MGLEVSGFEYAFSILNLRPMMTFKHLVDVTAAWIPVIEKLYLYLSYTNDFYEDGLVG